jgi:uncharacterized C2H2 Zn-finger protein
MSATPDMPEQKSEFKCQMCGMTFKTESELTDHNKNVHGK